MTRDDIIRLAREAGAATGRHSPYQKNESIMPLCMDVERFANLVAAAEREACAKTCDQLSWSHPDEITRVAFTMAADKIRARGAE
jgi:hypothetical protein